MYIQILGTSISVFILAKIGGEIKILAASILWDKKDSAVDI